MIKKILLKYTKGVYEDNNRILLYNLDEKVVLKFEGHTPANSKLILALKNGKIATQIEVVDKEVELPQNLVTEGQLQANLVAYIQGEEISNYKIEPLLISKLDRDIEVLPEIQQMQNELNGFRIKFENLISSFKKIVKVVGSVCNIDIIVNEDLTISAKEETVEEGEEK